MYLGQGRLKGVLMESNVLQQWSSQMYICINQHTLCTSLMYYCRDGDMSIITRVCLCHHAGNKIIDSDVLLLTSLSCTLLFVLRLIGWKNFQLICSVPADSLNMQQGQKYFRQRFCEISAIFTLHEWWAGYFQDTMSLHLGINNWLCEMPVFHILCINIKTTE